MPKASAPTRAVRAGVAVPQTIVTPGCVRPLLGSDDVRDALAFIAQVEQRDARRLGVLRIVRPAAMLGSGMSAVAFFPAVEL
jgi:hypothetical protein